MNELLSREVVATAHGIARSADGSGSGEARSGREPNWRKSSSVAMFTRSTHKLAKNDPVQSVPA